MGTDFFTNLGSDIHSVTFTPVKTNREKEVRQEKMKTIILRIFGCASMLIGFYGLYFTLGKPLKFFDLLSAAIFLTEGFDFAVIGKNKADAIRHLKSGDSAYLFSGTLVAKSIYNFWNNRLIT